MKTSIILLAVSVVRRGGLEREETPPRGVVGKRTSWRTYDQETSAFCSDRKSVV